MIIKTKFNINDVVWFIYNDEVVSGRIYAMKIKTNSSVHNQISYQIITTLDSTHIYEDKCFKTKKGLLKSL